VLDKMVTMREELRQMRLSTSARASNSPPTSGPRHRAEESGIAALREFSMKLRSARA
jgi:stearoyl-CoA desaturase (delta-9 desaturase)